MIKVCKTITGMKGNPLPVQDWGPFWSGEGTRLKRCKRRRVTQQAVDLWKSVSEVAVLDARGVRRLKETAGQVLERELLEISN